MKLHGVEKCTGETYLAKGLKNTPRWPPTSLPCLENLWICLKGRTPATGGHIARSWPLGRTGIATAMQ